MVVSPQFIFLSFVTLATMGYGDITFASNFARSIAICEAVTGIFYVAILISRLVAIYVSQSYERLQK
jgi:hypothetical protein